MEEKQGESFYVQPGLPVVTIVLTCVEKANRFDFN